MKTVKFLLLISAIGFFALSSFKCNAGDLMPETSKAKMDSISYTLGLWVGGMLKQSDFGEINMRKMNEGLKDVIDGKKDPSSSEISQIIQSYLEERQQFAAERRAAESKLFFEKNKTKDGVVETESGLQYKLIKEGDGLSPELVDIVEVNYVGTLIDGTEFDSSEKNNNGLPVKLSLNDVIKGWGEGMKYVKEGGKIEIYIPADLGYGAQSYGPILANSTLIFKVELVKVHKGRPVEQLESEADELDPLPY